MISNCISVIVPIYNTDLYLNDCIQSILNQTYRNIQLILVDDGSTDNSYAICKEWSNRDSRVEVFRQKNSGVSVARNNGLKHIKGNYLYFMDSDDSLIDDHLFEKCAKIFQSDVDVVIFGWTGKSTDKKRYSRITSAVNDINAIEASTKMLSDSTSLSVGMGYPWNKIWNLSKIIKNNRQVPLFNAESHTYEDLEWVLDMYANLKVVRLVPDIAYQYNVRESSLSHDSAKQETIWFNGLHQFEYMIDKYQDAEKCILKAIKNRYYTLLIYRVRQSNKYKMVKLKKYVKSKLRKNFMHILFNGNLVFKLRLIALRNMV